MTERVLPKGARLIPSEADCVFGGEIYKVYQWPQKMPDGSVKTFEMLRRPDTVMVIALDQAGDVLVIDEKQPGGVVRKNHLPVGRVDSSDESVLVAAQRELREETGCTFANWRLLDVVQMDKKIEWFTYLFLATGERYIEQRSILMSAKILRLNQRLWQKCCIKTTCFGIFRGFAMLNRPKI